MTSLLTRLSRFARKPPPDKWAAVKATLHAGIFGKDSTTLGRKRREKLLKGPHAPPTVTRTAEQIYLAYRPDSDFAFSCHPEIAQLSEKWIENNNWNNAGDLPRLYAILLNSKQVLEEGITGDMAELGVYRGNSAAVLAHYARKSGKKLLLFDTFEGFDSRDLVADDEKRPVEFDATSLSLVKDVVGEEAVRFVQGWFPQSIPPDLYDSRFCLVHIDCDLYEPAKAGLEFFYPRLSPGGLLVVHDYANPCWRGIKRAVDEFFSGKAEKPVVFGDKSGTAMFRKSAQPTTALDLDLTR